MMILAEVSSGRSLSDSRFSTKVERPGLAAATDGFDRRRAAVAAGWKEAVRTVIDLLGVADCTVWMALPA